MKIEKFKLPYLNSNMFIIIENFKAIIIDPNISEEAYKFLIKEEICFSRRGFFENTSSWNP